MIRSRGFLLHAAKRVSKTNRKDARVRASALLAPFSLALGLFATGAAAALKPGDAAPDFTVEARKAARFQFSLAEALKKGPVVLYFYPKSFTSVCTVEAHDFAENMRNFAAAGRERHRRFDATTSIRSANFRARNAATNSRSARTPIFRSSRPMTRPSAIPGIGPAFAHRVSYVIAPGRQDFTRTVIPAPRNTLKTLSPW